MARPGTVLAEYEDRRAAEQAKAVRKYGDDALLPAGRPDLDISDYALNELVGLVRYAQMLEARHQMMLDVMEGLPRATRQALKETVAFARVLESQAGHLAFELTGLRQRLKARGLHLGLTEEAT